MHVAVVVFVKVLFRFDDLSRLLRGSGVIEVYEGITVYFPFKYREVFAYLVGIQNYFSSNFSRFASIFASSSSSKACFSSNVCS